MFQSCYYFSSGVSFFKVTDGLGNLAQRVRSVRGHYHPYPPSVCRAAVGSSSPSLPQRPDFHSCKNLLVAMPRPYTLNVGYERVRILIPRASVNRIRRGAPGRARRVSRHTSRSGRALLSVPSYSTLDGFPERRGMLAELPLEPGVIYDEWFLELVEHLDRLADSRVE